VAPFLFLIVVERLVWIVREATKKNVYQGVRVGNKDVEVGLLQFSNDTLFVCQPTNENILVIKSILRSFEIVSGLKVNFYKSKK